MVIKNLADLRKIKAESQKETEARKHNETQVIIGMGTCGIAAGAAKVAMVLGVDSFSDARGTNHIR